MSIRARLALGVAVMTMVVVIVVAGVQYAALRSFLNGGERARLVTLLPQLEARLAVAGRDPTVALDALPRTVDIRVLRGNRVVAQTPDFPPLSPGLPVGFTRRAGHEVLVGTATLGDGQPGVIQLASDVLDTVDPLGSYLRSLALVAPGSAALAWLLSYTLAGALLRPLRRLEADAASVGHAGEWRRPLPAAERTDELGRLARVIQSVFLQVAELREREALFMQAAAHDLRSPLTALKARLQGALGGPRSAADLREDIAEALGDVERMRRLSDDLLLLARGERGVQRREVDLAQLTGVVVDRARDAHPDVQIDFETSGDVMVNGDATLLTQLAENLIGNAARYGQSAPVLVSVRRSAQAVTLAVHDRGPGVPEGSLGHLTQPFFRLDSARSGGGNGLGLAIVEQIAHAHYAQLRLSLDGGLRAEVAFPPPDSGG